jgi:hypothetical protein
MPIENGGAELGGGARPGPAFSTSVGPRPGPRGGRFAVFSGFGLLAFLSGGFSHLHAGPGSATGVGIAPGVAAASGAAGATERGAVGDPGGTPNALGLVLATADRARARSSSLRAVAARSLVGKLARNA